MKINELINTKPLTKVEKKIADFILTEPYKASLMTSTELAETLDISNTSVIRFSKSLGFTGYIQFKQALQNEYLTEAKPLPRELQVPSERLNIPREESDAQKIFIEQFQLVSNNIQSIFKRNTVNTINGFVEQLIDSKDIYIYGSRSLTGLASFFTLILSQSLKSVQLIPDVGQSPFDTLGSGDENSTLVIFSFSRYSILDKTMAQMAKDLRMKILLITDSLQSPVVEHATSVIYVDVDSKTFYNSYTSVFFVIDYLCSVVSNKIGLQNSPKLDIINKYISKLELY